MRCFSGNSNNPLFPNLFQTIQTETLLQTLEIQRKSHFSISIFKKTSKKRSPGNGTIDETLRSSILRNIIPNEAKFQDSTSPILLEWSRQSSPQQGTPRPIPVPRGHVAGPWPLHGLGEERARHAYILQQPGTSKKRAGMLEGRCKRGRKGEQKGGKMEPLTGGKKRNK